MLHFQPANLDQPLEKLPVVQKPHAVAAASLVPAPEPEQGRDFLSAKAPLGQLVPFNGVCLHAHCHVALFFSLDLLIHIHVLSTKARESDLLCESVFSWAGRHIGKAA